MRRRFAHVWFAAIVYALAGCGPGSPSDIDGDGVANGDDAAPDDARVCGDSDQDGCDDCSVLGRADPDNDGWDPDGDGTCELALDWDCMHGDGAAGDASRSDACASLALANADRARFADESGNAAPLRWSESLWAVAFAHSQDMCTHMYFAHDTPAGQGPHERAMAAGLDFPVSENIALNLDARAAAYSFMREATCRGHRRNLLDPQAVEVGIGYWRCDNPSYPSFGHHHHITEDFRVDFDRAASPYCADPSTDCELPPDPPSVAVGPPDLVAEGFCPPVDATILSDWSCPND